MKRNSKNRLRYITLSAICMASVMVLAEPAATVNTLQKEQTTESKTISGKVTDMNTSEALAGVTITLAGKKAYTDLEGNFTLPCPSDLKQKLVVSQISYRNETVEVTASNTTSLTIKLKQH